ncbi:unnamed protein product [Sphenostylis stenocarpa]|uniref:Uncharacterized protein n=1 Tax=Sphenostylis stenocarpa TaxID=92480 RepID=A0AA86SLP3_9FABA|nr:unnamed protein product [Sphenostylis stenocarpa]
MQSNQKVKNMNSLLLTYLYRITHFSNARPHRNNDDEKLLPKKVQGNKQKSDEGKLEHLVIP